MLQYITDDFPMNEAVESLLPRSNGATSAVHVEYGQGLLGKPDTEHVHQKTIRALRTPLLSPSEDQAG